MTSAQIQRLILEELMHGPANLFEIAKAIDQAPFRVRAELRCLNRDRLVHGVFIPERYVWEITDLGRRSIWHGRQTKMEAS